MCISAVANKSRRNCQRTLTSGVNLANSPATNLKEHPSSGCSLYVLHLSRCRTSRGNLALFHVNGRGDLQGFLLHIGIRGICRPACFFSVFRRFMQFHTTVYQSLPFLCGRIAFSEPNDLWLQAEGQGSKAVRWLVAYETVYSHNEKGSRSQKGSKMAL